jgi:hypothetical protein
MTYQLGFTNGHSRMRFRQVRSSLMFINFQSQTAITRTIFTFSYVYCYDMSSTPFTIEAPCHWLTL